MKTLFNIRSDDKRLVHFRSEIRMFDYLYFELNDIKYQMGVGDIFHFMIKSVLTGNIRQFLLENLYETPYHVRLSEDVTSFIRSHPLLKEKFNETFDFGTGQYYYQTNACLYRDLETINGYKIKFLLHYPKWS